MKTDLRVSFSRLLSGVNGQPITHFWARKWFLRGLGLVYLIAFISLWVQVDGLIGRNGVLPVADFLSAVRQQIGPRAFSLLPTLCWFNRSDAFLHFLCGSGVVLSLLLILGFVPVISLVLLFVSYLSLTIAGQTFFSFQWDILLLETGFLAIFFAPWQFRWKWSGKAASLAVSGAGLFLLQFLLFKLMFMSGVVKLTSGDDCWANLTALDYHYWSQPLPTMFAWWADKTPQWIKEFSVAFCLFVEIIVPFFIWAPRRFRLIAAALLIFLQLGIAITGSYCFFNLLTIVLCLLLIDDVTVERARRALRLKKKEGRAPASPVTASSREVGPPSRRMTAVGQRAIGWTVLVISLPFNGWLLFSAFKPEVEPPRPIASAFQLIDPFRIINGYGLFRVMTKDRREIIIEGSANGIDWAAYEFKWKPGNVDRAPGWCAPHQPRLDWQMWFAALSPPEQNPWFLRLLVCLLENKPAVTGLLGTNPFPETGPRYIRAEFYRYRFTTIEERRRTGAWWRRQELGEYVPTVSLK